MNQSLQLSKAIKNNPLKELEVEWKLKPALSDEEKNTFMDAWMEEVEKEGLTVGGSLDGDTFSGVIDFSGSELNEEEVKQWLQSRCQARLSAWVVSVSTSRLQ